MNDFYGDKYRPQTIEKYSSRHVKDTFKSFVEQGEIPISFCLELLVLVKLQLPKHLMSWLALYVKTDLMKVDSWTLYAIRQRTLFLLKFLPHCSSQSSYHRWGR